MLKSLIAMPVYKVTDPTSGLTLKLTGDSPPTDQDLDEIFAQYKTPARARARAPEPEDETTIGGQIYETVKAIPRGFASSFMSAGEGIAELADAVTDYAGFEDAIDSGEENWLVERSRKGRDHINQALGADAAYRDKWSTKFGEGVGSFAAFFTPGGIARVLGIAGKGASLMRGVGTGTIAVGTGAGDQARRIEMAREEGIEVSDAQENQAILEGSLWGLSELAPVHRLLKGIGKEMGKPVIDRLKSALKQGGIEAVQEVSASLLQDMTERRLYNENLPETESLLAEFFTSDDATVGGAVGFASDLLLNAASGRRRTQTTQAQVEKELEEREKENELFAQEAVDLQAERQARAASEEPDLQGAARAQAALEQERAVDPAQIENPEQQAFDETTTDSATSSRIARLYGSIIAKTMGAAFPNNTAFNAEEGPTVEVPRQRQDAEGNVVETTTTEPTFIVRDSEGRQYGTPQFTFENAQRLAYSLNTQIIDQNVREAVRNILDVAPKSYTEEEYAPLARIGYRILHPDAQTFTSAAVNHAAGTTQDQGYDETISAEEAMFQNGDPDYTENLTAAQKINKDRLAQGLSEVDAFTVQEVRSVLGKDFGDISHVSVNAPIETETYEARIDDRGRPVVISSVGEVINSRRPTIAESFRRAGTPSWAQTKYLLRDRTRTPLQSLEEAQAFAAEMNANRGVAPVAEEVFLDDITVEDINRVLESKNIASDANSPEVAVIAKAAVGKSSVKRMTAGERRLLYQRLRSMPRFDVLTKLPVFKPKPYTRDQFAMAAKIVEESGDSSLEAISAATGISLDEARGKVKLLALKGDLASHGLAEAKAAQEEAAAESAPVIAGLLPGPDNGLMELRARLRETMDRLGLKDVGLRVDQALQAVRYDTEGNPIYLDEAAAAELGLPSVKGTEGYYKPAMNAIFVALDNTKVADNATPEQRADAVANVLDHEIVHAMRMMDLWTAKEWFALENLARRKINRQTRASYLDTAVRTYADQNPVVQMEEAIAEMIRHSRRDNTLATGKPRSLIKRLFEFMERLRSSMRGTGFQSFDDVVTRVNSGEVGARQRGVVRTLRGTEGRAGIVPERQIGTARIAGSSPATAGEEEDAAATGQSLPDFMAARTVLRPRIPDPKEELPVLAHGEVEEQLADLFKDEDSPTSGQLMNILGAPTPRKKTNKKGKKVRNPMDRYVRPVDMKELRRRAATGLEQSGNLRWYDEFALGIQDVVGEANIDEASVIFGITSARQSPEINLAVTYHIMRVAREVNPVDNEQAFKDAVRQTRRPNGPKLMITGDQINRIARLYNEGFAEGGMKTTTYMQIIQDRARNLFNPFSVHDVHMARMFGFLSRNKHPKTGNVVDDAKIPSDLSYRYAQWMTSKLAKEFDVSPNQMQAALWFYAKKNLTPDKGGMPGTWASSNNYARREREAIEKQVDQGIFDQGSPLTPALAEGVRPKSAIKTPTRPYSNVEQTGELMGLARAESPVVRTSAAPGNERLYGFPDTVTLDQLVEYNRRAIEAITDKGGQIPFLRDIGIPHEVRESIGTYEGIEPGIVVRLLGGNLEQTSMVASVLGDALLQDSALAEQPKYNDGENAGYAVSKANGEAFTLAELEGLAESVNPENDPNGLNFSLISPDTVAFVDGKSFTKGIVYNEEMLEEFYVNLSSRLPATLDLKTGVYYQDVKFIKSGEYQSHIGKIRDQGIASRTPDLYQRINDTLYQPIWDLYTEAAEQIGFRPGNTSRPILAGVNSYITQLSIKGLPAEEVAAVAEASRIETEEASAGAIPRINDRAAPEAQYIAKNPDKGEVLPDHLREKFSRANEPELSEKAQAVMDRVSNPQTSDSTPGEEYIEVTEGMFKGTFRDMMTRFRAAAVFKYAPIERLSEHPSLRGLLADSSAIASVLFADRSRGVLAAALKEGVVTYKDGLTKVVPFIHGGRSYRGLIEVINPLYDNPYNKSLEKLAQTYAVTRRGQRLNDQGKMSPVVPGDRETIDAEIRQFINPETGNPIIEEWYDAWQAYNQHTVKFMVDTGLLNTKEGEHWLQHSDYYPFYKQDQEKPVDLFAPVGKSGESAKTIDEEMLKAITKNLARAIDLGMRNVAKQRVIRDAVTVGVARDASVPGVVVTEEDNVVDFRVKGKKRRFIVDDSLLYESMNTMADSGLGPFVNNVLGGPATLLRAMVTREPGFVIANMLRDTLSAFVTSGSNFIPVWDTVKGFSQGLSTLEKYGVVGGYDFKDDPNDVVKFIARESRKRGGHVGDLGTVEQLFETPGLKYFKRAWQFTGQASSASDASTRKAVYDDVLARTGNEAEAAFQALEVINFSRRGGNPLLRTVFAAVPFLNARVQGLDVLYRAFSGKYSAKQQPSRGKVALTAAVRGSYLMGLTALYYTMVSDEEEYKQASIQERDDYWMFPGLGAGEAPLRIPIPFEVGILFKVIPERILDSIYGSTTPRQLKQSMQRQIESTLEFNLATNVAAWGPLYEAATNKSGHSGQAIVPVWMENGDIDKIAPAFQSRVGTNEAARMIGETLNISPLKVEHVMAGYTGTLGRYAMDLLDATLRHGLDGNVLPKREVTQYPIVKRFFASPEGRGLQEQYYELKGEVDQLVTTLNRLEDQGRFDEADALERARSNILDLKRDVNFLNKRIRRLRKEKDQVLRSDYYDAEEKAEVRREIDADINELLEYMPELMKEANLPMFGTPLR